MQSPTIPIAEIRIVTVFIYIFFTYLVNRNSDQLAKVEVPFAQKSFTKTKKGTAAAGWRMGRRSFTGMTPGTA